MTIQEVLIGKSFPYSQKKQKHTKFGMLLLFYILASLMIRVRFFDVGIIACRCGNGWL